MSDQFPFDVFLSHSARDKAVVRAVAERSRKDGLKVWFDEWVLKPKQRRPGPIPLHQLAPGGPRARAAYTEKISRRNWRLSTEGLLAQTPLSGRIPGYVSER